MNYLLIVASAAALFAYVHQVPVDVDMSPAWLNFVVAGLSAVSGLMKRKAAKKSAGAQEDIAAQNRAATLKNGRINAAITRFDAIGPKFKALMAADNARTNQRVLEFNSDITRKEGAVRGAEFSMRVDNAMADMQRAREDVTLTSRSAARERRAANTQFQTDLDNVEKDAERKKAMTMATFAATGVSMDAGVMNAVDNQVMEDTDQEIANVLLSRIVENKSIGGVQRAARREEEGIVRRGEAEVASLGRQGKFTKMAAEREALSQDLAASRMADEGDYMDWYSGFVEESAEIRASHLETGAELSATGNFNTAMANAESTRRAGDVAALAGLGQATGQIYQGIKV
jgi:hypothetical protein